MRTSARWLAAGAAMTVMVAGLVAQAGSASAESNGGVRVMPLGDSITEGTQVPGGYRIGLWQRLANGRYTTDFVGSQYNGPASLGDHDHEGHPGWRIDQIDANIVGWLNTYQPHTVLLHIGTNDILQNYNVSTAPNRLSTLIDHITNTAPAAEVFVAQLTPLANSGQESAVRTFNAAIPGIVQSKVNAGKHVHLVDMHSAVTTADLIDGIHPTANGYDKMAAVWYGALQAVPGSIGTPGDTGGSTTQIVGAQSGRCLDVPNGSTTNGIQVQLYDCWGGTMQRWTYTAAKQLQVLGTKCLDAEGGGTANGTRVITWDCNGRANQQWNINPNGTISGVQSGRCLDAYNWGTANGTKIVLWDCHGGANQQWILRS
ncbi:GDSL family lipase [Micromonospora sp. PPF5-17]|uniref:GDSL family lipase n=1 Tax=Micromonospora solifontis TaxID=2487138 RepID=A0ABX9WEZ6_9ACTN|nr:MULTISPECIES: RICIN domain-containing protein [Micromonospora]NES37373.1 GDSL family lipase [Micromonospora solifontis]NES58082.1 GDSL family lipase [Micromonospora sp. PPF5-6]RNL98382.1 GDSL family lipase [Micromonospora solifontis]